MKEPKTITGTVASVEPIPGRYGRYVLLRLSLPSAGGRVTFGDLTVYEPTYVALTGRDPAPGDTLDLSLVPVTR